MHPSYKYSVSNWTVIAKIKKFGILDSQSVIFQTFRINLIVQTSQSCFVSTMAITSCFIGAPQDCPKFQRLCQLLASNDLTTAVVETWRESTPFGYGESLGAALQNNTVVSELFLQLSFLLDEQEMVAGTAGRVSRLLHFLKDSPTLQSLRLAVDLSRDPRIPSSPGLASIAESAPPQYTVAS
jgi:hypothetical protein